MGRPPTRPNNTFGSVREFKDKRKQEIRDAMLLRIANGETSYQKLRWSGVNFNTIEAAIRDGLLKRTDDRLELLVRK